MATKFPNSCRIVADLLDFTSDLGLVKTGAAAGAGTQLSNIIQADNCGELMLLMEISAGDLTVKAKNEADEVLDFTTGATTMVLDATTNPRDWLKLSLSDILKIFWGLKFTTTAGYTISKMLVLEAAKIPAGRDYHVVTNGFMAIPKDGVGATFTEVLP